MPIGADASSPRCRRAQGSLVWADCPELLDIDTLQCKAAVAHPFSHRGRAVAGRSQGRYAKGDAWPHARWLRFEPIT